MAHLDKKDFDGLRATLHTMEKPDLADSLVALIGMPGLADAFEIAGQVPGKDRIEQTISTLDAAGMKYRSTSGSREAWTIIPVLFLKGLPITSGLKTRSLAEGHIALPISSAGTILPPAGLP